MRDMPCTTRTCPGSQALLDATHRKGRNYKRCCVTGIREHFMSCQWNNSHPDPTVPRYGMGNVDERVICRYLLRSNRDLKMPAPTSPWKSLSCSKVYISRAWADPWLGQLVKERDGRAVHNSGWMLSCEHGTREPTCQHHTLVVLT